MMGKTFQDNHEDTHRTWIFPFAMQVEGGPRSVNTTDLF
jgi:hypothetical protein